MKPRFDQCEVCGADVMFRNEKNTNKFPASRRYLNEERSEGLLSVRCAECSDLPYKLEAGQPYRATLLGRENVNVIGGFNSQYSFYPFGLGHFLEIYSSSPSEETIASVLSAPISIGFLTEESVKLIVLAYRLEGQGWNVTPYQWHAPSRWPKTLPSLDQNPGSGQSITVALVNTKGGCFSAIRKDVMPTEFTNAFHKAINQQAAEATPDWRQVQARIENLWELLDEKKLLPLLSAQCTI